MDTITPERDEGYKAFINNKNEADCPYDWETDEYYLWMDGYFKAREDWIDAALEVEMY